MIQEKGEHQVRREILQKLEPRMARRPNGLKLVREYSRGDEKLLRLAESLVEVAQDLEHLKGMAYAIWPRLGIYTGDTHVRFMTAGQGVENSFYVDTTQ